MKKRKYDLNRRLRPGALVWSGALAAAGAFFALPDLTSPDFYRSVLKDVVEQVLPDLAGKLPGMKSNGLNGTATVIDGDTIDIGKQRIRLHALDAPESAQRCWKGGVEWRCGQKAALELQAKIGRRSVSCEQVDTDRYGRIVGRCFVGSENLNAWLVEEGLALAAPQYGKDYVAHEARAKAARRGVWAGEFIQPSDWRKGVRELQG